MDTGPVVQIRAARGHRPTGTHQCSTIMSNICLPTTLSRFFAGLSTSHRRCRFRPNTRPSSSPMSSRYCQNSALQGLNSPSGSPGSPNPSWGTLQALRTVEWPWWTFHGSWRWQQLNLLKALSTTESVNSTTSSARSISLNAPLYVLVRMCIYASI
jgi:hypothetical protein